MENKEYKTECLRVKNILLNCPTICNNWEQLFRGIVPHTMEHDFSNMRAQHLSGAISNTENLIHRLVQAAFSASGSLKQTVTKIANSAKELGFCPVHDELLNHPEMTEPFCWNEQKTVEKLFGRDVHLSQLDDYYHKPTSNITILSGLPGMGKLELAKEFLRRGKQNRICTAWIPSGNSSELKSHCRELAKHVLELTNISKKSLLSLMIETSKCVFEKSGKRWIIVFDQCDPDTAEENCLFQFSQNCYDQVMIIFTSCVRNFKKKTDVIDVLELPKTEAVNFVRSVLTNETSENISLLCDLTRNFPIVMRHAISYIQYQQNHSFRGSVYNIKSYIAERKALKEQDISMGLSSFATPEEKAFEETLKTSLIKIKNCSQSAFCILEILAYGNPSDFSLALLQTIFKIIEPSFDEAMFNDGLNVLKGFCITNAVVEGPDQWKLEINPIVQDVIKRTMLEPNNAGLQKVKQYLEHTEIHTLQEIHDIKQYVSLWRHVVSFVDRDVTGILRHTLTILNCLDNHSLYYDMLKFTTTAARIYRSTPELTNLPIATLVIEKHASILVEFEMFNPAYEEFEYLYTIHNRQGDLEQAFDRLHDIGTVHLNKQELNKAMEVYDEVLRKRLDLYQCENEKTMATRANIANTYLERGDYARTKAEFAKVIQWQLHEKNDIGRGLMSMHSLGYCHFKEESYEEARKLFESALQTVDEVSLKPVGQLICQYNLGRTLFYLGFKKKGLDLLTEVYEGQITLFGQNHLDAKKTLDWISRFRKSCLPTSKETPDISGEWRTEETPDGQRNQSPVDKESQEQLPPQSSNVFARLTYDQHKSGLKAELRKKLLQITIQKYDVQRSYCETRIKLAQDALENY